MWEDSQTVEDISTTKGCGGKTVDSGEGGAFGEPMTRKVTIGAYGCFEFMQTTAPFEDFGPDSATPGLLMPDGDGSGPKCNRRRGVAMIAPPQFDVWLNVDAHGLIKGVQRPVNTGHRGHHRADGGKRQGQNCEAQEAVPAA